MATKATGDTSWSHQSSQHGDGTRQKRSRKAPSKTTGGKPSSSATTKRKIPQLPSAVWGRILDVLPYKDVRRALPASKLLAVEAARHVRLLSIYHASELNVRAARRFCNVSEVNVFSLIRRNEWVRSATRPIRKQRDFAESESSSDDSSSTSSESGASSDDSMSTASSRESNARDRDESVASDAASMSTDSTRRESNAGDRAEESNPRDRAEWATFCPETARRVVPFLSLFGNLTKCFVCGDVGCARIYWESTEPNIEYQTGENSIREGKYQVYFSEEVGGSRMLYEIGGYDGSTGYRGRPTGKPDDIEVINNSKESHKEMLAAFVNAFRAMALPVNLEVRGVMEFVSPGVIDSVDHTNNTCDPLVATDGNSCKLCREMCETFPLDLVYSFIVNNPYQRVRTRGGRLRSRRYPAKGQKAYPGGAGNVCISDRDRYAIMNARPLGRDIVMKKGKEMLRRILKRGFQFQNLLAPFDSSSGDFEKRMKKRGAVVEYLVFYYHSDILKAARALVEAGCPLPCREEVKDLVSQRRVMMKSSFDALVDMGFPLQKDDFILVNPATDPFLADYDWGDERSEEEDIIGDDGGDGDY